MFSIDDLSAVNSNQLCLEFSETEREQAWQNSQYYSNDAARWNAYLNYLCFNTLIPWIQSELDLPTPPEIWPNRESLPSILDFVNGTVLTVDQTRIALIPSEAFDRLEFSVPAEWVDIPDWAADYYLAVQINPDDLWLQVWGFSTHSQLKCQGYFDSSDRTYNLEGDDLIQNLNALWVSLELCSNEKAALANVPNLSATEAENLVQQLGDRTLYSPRLEVEFEKWAALLENHTYRQQLYELRIGGESKPQTQVSRRLVNLSQWFENVVEIGWQTIEELFAMGEANLAFSMRSGLQMSEGDANREETLKSLIEQVYGGKTEHQRKIAAEGIGDIGGGNREAIAALIHLIRSSEEEETRWAAAESLWAIDPGNPAAGVRRVTDFGMLIAGHAVALMVAIVEKAQGKVAILLRVYPMRNQVYLPPNLELVVLDETGETFLEAQARNADNRIQLKFSGDRGERFSVRVALGDASVTEDFAI
jgi:Protein of unknown function (DUF1822)